MGVQNKQGEDLIDEVFIQSIEDSYGLTFDNDDVDVDTERDNVVVSVDVKFEVTDSAFYKALENGIKQGIISAKEKKKLDGLLSRGDAGVTSSGDFYVDGDDSLEEKMQGLLDDLKSVAQDEVYSYVLAEVAEMQRDESNKMEESRSFIKEGSELEDRVFKNFLNSPDRYGVKTYSGSIRTSNTVPSGGDYYFKKFKQGKAIEVWFVNRDDYSEYLVYSENNGELKEGKMSSKKMILVEAEWGDLKSVVDGFNHQLGNLFDGFLEDMDAVNVEEYQTIGKEMRTCVEKLRTLAKKMLIIV